MSNPGQLRRQAVLVDLKVPSPLLAGEPFPELQVFPVPGLGDLRQLMPGAGFEVERIFRDPLFLQSLQLLLQPCHVDLDIRGTCLHAHQGIVCEHAEAVGHQQPELGKDFLPGIVQAVAVEQQLGIAIVLLVQLVDHIGDDLGEGARLVAHPGLHDLGTGEAQPVVVGYPQEGFGVAGKAGQVGVQHLFEERFLLSRG